jgi:predicted metal-dependent phosphoesterase TrpH
MSGRSGGGLLRPLGDPEEYHVLVFHVRIDPYASPVARVEEVTYKVKAHHPKEAFDKVRNYLEKEAVKEKGEITILEKGGVRIQQGLLIHYFLIDRITGKNGKVTFVNPDWW